MDKRKNNGGHSTKATGVDKRRNPYRQAINDSETPEDVVSVIRTLKNLAVNDGDVPAAKVYLEYTVGKPKQEIDLETNGNLSIGLAQLVKFGDES